MTITIFIADDHEILRAGVRLLLESQPKIKVIGDAGNGRDAVVQVLKLRPKVVVMDLAMPEMDGIEATQKICAAWPGAAIIILSMHSQTEYVVRAFQAGARGFLVKESAGVELFDAVRKVAGGFRYLSHQISGQTLSDVLSSRRGTESAGPMAQLSTREREILVLVADGKSSAEIARGLSLSPKTVETYRSRMMTKLGVRNVAGLVKFALSHGVENLGFKAPA
jgi:DNA-binding NarL/FixJ family response regulator